MHGYTASTAPTGHDSSYRLDSPCRPPPAPGEARTFAGWQPVKSGQLKAIVNPSFPATRRATREPQGHGWVVGSTASATVLASRGWPMPHGLGAV